MTRNFHNSNKESGHQLAASERKAKTQNQRVLEFFKRYPALGRTALDVYFHLAKNEPESSFRRACTTLTDGGFLKETGDKKIAAYGKANRTYIITPRGLKHKTK
jgi:hypothetical protein